MFDNGGLVKLRRMGVVMYCWIKHATRRKKEPCPKCRKRKVQKMLSLSPSAMERLNYQLGLTRDRFLRHQSVLKDLALDLPVSIPLPDGEEIPYGSSIRLKLRDPMQESELTDTCIRPPPNRTISLSEVEPLPPYALYLSGRLQPKKSGDLLERTARCFGMKRAEEPIPEPPPHPPLCVYVPINPRNRSRHLAALAKKAPTDLDSVPGVSCAVPDQYMPANRPTQAAPGALQEPKPGSQFSGLTTGAPARASVPAVTSAAAGTSASAVTSPSAGTSGAAASALSDYIDTKGPETMAERMASAYYRGAYSDTKGPARSQEGDSARAASSTNEHRDAKGAEKKGDKGSA